MTATNTTAPAVESTTNGVADATAPGQPVRPDGAAGAVWDALTANPGASTMTIANAAGVSRPTVTKALAALAEAGRATRTAGGRNENGKALSDTWAPIIDTAEPQNVSDTSGPDTEQPGHDQNEEGAARPGMSVQEAMRILAEEDERRTKAEAELARATAEEEDRRKAATEALTKAREEENTRQALADLLSAVTATYASLVSGDDTAVDAGLEAIYAGAQAARRTRGPRGSARNATPAGASWGSRRGDRNAPRPLRPDVAAHLAKFPDLTFTAGEIAKVLARSSGAVANALDALTRDGESELASESPNRYRLATPSEAPKAPEA